MNQTSQELKYQRVMLKLSGEALAGDKGFGITPEVVDRLTDEIGSVASMGVSLGVVIGGGNIVRGAIASRSGMDRVQADYMGMLATVINALAVQDLLEHKGIETRVMTAIRMEEIAEPYIDCGTVYPSSRITAHGEGTRCAFCWRYWKPLFFYRYRCSASCD